MLDRISFLLTHCTHEFRYELSLKEIFYSRQDILTGTPHEILDFGKSIRVPYVFTDFTLGLAGWGGYFGVCLCRQISIVEVLTFYNMRP